MEEVKDAYRKLAFTLHPDRGGNTKEFQQLYEEFTYIRDEKPGLPIIQPAAKKRDFTDYTARQREPDYTQPMSRRQRGSPPRSSHTPDPSLINLDVFIMVVSKFMLAQEESSYKKNWVWYQVKDYIKKNNRTMGIPHLNNMAIRMGFGPDWILYRMQELIKENLFAN